MARQNTSKRLPRWQRLVGQWQQSGKSVAGFCRAHRLKQPTFYTWRARLEKLTRRHQTANTFIPVRVVASPSAQIIELALRDGRVLKVHGELAPSRFAELAAALEARPC